MFAVRMHRPPSALCGVLLLSVILFIPVGPAGSAARQPTNPAAYRLILDASFSLSQWDESHATAAVVDSAAGFAYFGTWSVPVRIVKVRLSDFVRVDTLTLDPDDQYASGAVIDPAGGFAYFAVGLSPTTAQLVKIDLSTFTQVASLTFPAAEKDLHGGVIDDSGTYAYFCTASAAARIVKIRLTDMTRVDGLALNLGESSLDSAVVDYSRQVAYFGGMYGSNSQGFITKIDLATFTVGATLSFLSGEYGSPVGVLDPGRGYGYFADDSNPGHIIRVRLSDFTRVDRLDLPTGDGYVSTALIDPQVGYAYFTTGMLSPGGVVQVRLDGFTRYDKLVHGGDARTWVGVVDPTRGYLAYGYRDGTAPGQILRMNYSADLAVIATAPGAVRAGETMTHTLSVTNYGPNDAVGMMVTDTLPSGVTFVSASAGCMHSAGSVMCSTPELAYGHGITFSLQVGVDPGATGLLTSTIAAHSTIPDALPANNGGMVTSLVASHWSYLPLCARQE